LRTSATGHTRRGQRRYRRMSSRDNARSAFCETALQCRTFVSSVTAGSALRRRMVEWQRGKRARQHRGGLRCAVHSVAKRYAELWNDGVRCAVRSACCHSTESPVGLVQGSVGGKSWCIHFDLVRVTSDHQQLIDVNKRSAGPHTTSRLRIVASVNGRTSSCNRVALACLRSTASLVDNTCRNRGPH
jgi:hypothetical protein